MPTSRVGNHILSHDCSFHTLNQIHFWLCSTKSQIPGTAINDCIQPTHTLKGSRHNTFEPNGGVANALTPTYTSQGRDHHGKSFARTGLSISEDCRLCTIECFCDEWQYALIINLIIVLGVLKHIIKCK